MLRGAKAKELNVLHWAILFLTQEATRAGTGERFPYRAGQGDGPCILRSLTPGVCLRALQKQCPG